MSITQDEIFERRKKLENERSKFIDDAMDAFKEYDIKYHNQLNELRKHCENFGHKESSYQFFDGIFCTRCGADIKLNILDSKDKSKNAE